MKQFTIAIELSTPEDVDALGVGRAAASAIGAFGSGGYVVTALSIEQEDRPE